jgi:hypothetical protein
VGLVALPYDPQPHEIDDITQVNANLAAILAAVNGGLDATNIVTGAPPNPLDGNTPGIGVLAALARADHGHVIQGMERLSADPTTGNEVGREYFNTVTLEKRLCINDAGAGTWVTNGNPTAAELVIHAAQHKDGGHDPLPDGILTDHMKAARTVFSASQAADVNAISTTGYTTVASLSVTTVGAQTLLILVSHHAGEHVWLAPQGRRARRRYDGGGQPHDPPSSAEGHRQHGGADQVPIEFAFVYTTPVAGGVRSLQLAAGADGAGVNIVKSAAFNADSFVPDNIAGGDRVSTQRPGQGQGHRQLRRLRLRSRAAVVGRVVARAAGSGRSGSAGSRSLRRGSETR